MSDTRARVALNGKVVNLAQLAAEVGAALCCSDTEVVAAEGADVTQERLAAAVAAHVADPLFGLPADEKKIREYAGKASLSAQETAEAIRLLLKKAAR